jgi:hypothetical protein
VGRTRFVRLAKRAMLVIGGLLVASTAFVGFLHTKSGRPLMMMMFGARCPLLSATPEAVDNARRMGVLAERGAAPAPARPAFGFHLDATTASEVRSWTDARHLNCHAEHTWLLQCRDVDPEILGGPAHERPIEELSFGFRPDGRLVSVTTLRRRLTSAEGTRIAQQIGSGLYADLGKTLPSSGRIGEGTLSSASLSSLRISLRYSDYFADVSAMNLPTTGVAVREQYLSASD